MEAIEFDFKNYIELYNRGIPLKDMNPLRNPTYKVLSSSNVDIRVIDRDANYTILSKCDKIKHFTIDTNKASHRYFYAIPLQTPNGTYVGFIYRTLFDKSYASVYRPFESKIKKVPYMFGFYKDFNDYDKRNTCMPIVVCEGVKDAIVLKRFYPYVLSNNTSQLGIGTHILANITDKVLLAYDNDSAGKRGISIDKRTLTNLGVSVDVLNYTERFKDAADYIDHPQDIKELRQQLKNKLKGLMYGTVMTV